MDVLIEEYFGSILSGQITMGQMLILAGAALLVFTLLLSIVFSVFKVKYKPEKVRKEEEPQVQTVSHAAQNGTVMLPKNGQAAQNGTVVLPKKDQPMRTENGTVILPKQEKH